MESVAVPFSYDFVRGANWTGYEVQGVLRTEPDGLMIEFREQRDDSMGRKSRVEPIRTIMIPWSEVQSVAVRAPWLGRPRIVLRTRSLRALEGLPDVEGAEAVLLVSRADRGLARELAAHAEAALAEHRLRALDAPDPDRRLDAPASPRTLPPV